MGNTVLANGEAGGQAGGQVRSTSCTGPPLPCPDRGIQNGSDEDENEDMLDLSSNQSSNFSSAHHRQSPTRVTSSSIGTAISFSHQFGSSSNGGSDSEVSTKEDVYGEDDDDDKSPAPLKIAEQDDEEENFATASQEKQLSIRNLQ